MVAFAAFAVLFVVLLGTCWIPGRTAHSVGETKSDTYNFSIHRHQVEQQAFRIGRLLLTKESGHLWWRESQDAESHRLLIATQRTLAWLESDQYADAFIVVIDVDGKYVGVDAAMKGRFDFAIIESVHAPVRQAGLKGVGIPRQSNRSN